MWKQLLDFGNKLVSLMRRTQKLEEDHTELRQELKEVRQEIKELNRRLDQLANAVQLFAFEVQRDRENTERDRELQRVQLENIMLRSKRRLPPGNRDEESEKDAQIEALKRENEELKKRLEQLEQKKE